MTYNCFAILSQVTVKYPFEDALLVDLQSIYMNGKAVLLAFYQDGTIQTVDPATGNTSVLAVVTNITRQINCVSVRPASQEIFLFTMNSDGKPHYAITTFNYNTLQTVRTHTMFFLTNASIFFFFICLFRLFFFSFFFSLTFFVDNSSIL